MKRIFLDTNFLIDYLVRDEYKDVSKEFLKGGIIRDYKFYVSFLSVANFAYIARRMPKNDLYVLLNRISELFEIIPNNRSQILNAIKIGSGKDFEDQLQYCTAIDAGCECIITRNEKDFMFSGIPVYSATDFMRLYFK